MQGETKKQGGITKSEDRKQETKAAKIEVIAGLERAIAQKELVIDRFRERVMTLEQEVEKLQLEATNQESMKILMDSLQSERVRSAQLELKLSAYSTTTSPDSVFSAMETLSQGNTLLKELNLTLSNRLLSMESQY